MNNLIANTYGKRRQTTLQREWWSSLSRKAALTIALLGLFLFGIGRAPATLLYVTSSLSPFTIYHDQSLIPNSKGVYFNPVKSPDSLMFDTSGNLIYSAISDAQIRIYIANATTPDQLIAQLSSSSFPADVALEPGGLTMLVSEFAGGKIDRISLANPSHPVTQLWPPSNGPGSGNPEGLVYDNLGRLFANLGTRSTSAQKFVAEISPVTGTILQQSPLLSSLDGLTYDSSTNMLYAASLFGHTVYRLDPNNLSSPAVDLKQLYGWTNLQVQTFAPDGITSDGSGHLFAASVGLGYGGDGHIYDIDLTTGTLTPRDLIDDGLDDLAPASGLGAPPEEPFPGQQCCGDKPHYEDPAYSTVFTGQVAIATGFASLGSNPVLTIEDLKNQATAPLNTNYAPPSYHGPGSSWTRDNLGDIFGLTLDESGNIYVTATTAYTLDVYPATSNSAMNIYKIASGSGAISVFKTLPQSPATRPGAGLGNIAFDCTYKNFYVSNIDDGLIYRLDINGNTLSTWDHGLNLPTALPPAIAIPDDPKVAFTPLGRRVWGLRPHDNRLYYAVWWENARRPDPVHANEIWSIGLSNTGDFVPGTDRLEISMPVDVYWNSTVTNYSNPVSDISFSPTGTMLLAERTMVDDTTPNVAEGRALEYVLTGTTWVPTANVFSIGEASAQSLVPRLIVPATSAGGVDSDFGAGGKIWFTGDALHLNPPDPDFIYGLQGLPATGGSIVNSILIDLNGNISGTDDTTTIGDVEIPCPDCEVNGTVLTPVMAGSPYSYQFTITNHSSKPANAIIILPVSGVTSITPQAISLSPALQPGQTSQPFTLTLNGTQPGVQACFNIALIAADGTTCCTRQVCVPIPDCFEVLSQTVTCLPNGQVQLSVTVKSLAAYTLYYAAVVPSDPTKTATPSFLTLNPAVPPYGTTTITTVISPVGALETVFYTLTVHYDELETCCSRELSFTASCKRKLTGASSRLTQATAGSFDTDMPLIGTSGVEDRDGSGNYLAVFTYDDAVTSADVRIVSGTATAGEPIFNGNEVQIPLSGVADQQSVIIEVSNVNGEEGFDDVTFGFLIGDVNGDRKVGATDGNLVKINNGQPVSDSNFRDDVNRNGRVDRLDRNAVSANQGHRLP